MRADHGEACGGSGSGGGCGPNGWLGSGRDVFGTVYGTGDCVSAFATLTSELLPEKNLVLRQKVPTGRLWEPFCTGLEL